MGALFPTSVEGSFKVDGEKSGFDVSVTVSGTFSGDFLKVEVSNMPRFGIGFPDGEKTSKWEFSGIVPPYLKNYETTPQANGLGFARAGTLYACALLERKWMTVVPTCDSGKGTLSVSCGRRTKIGDVVTFRCVSKKEEGYVVDYVNVWDGKNSQKIMGYGRPTLSGKFTIPSDIEELPIEIEAVFKKSNITVQTRNIGYGITSPTSKTVKGGELYTLTATPNDGALFKKWVSSEGKTIEGTKTITEKAGIYDIVWQGYFSTDEFTLTLKSNNEAYGSVVGGGVYPYNKQLILFANPKEGYEFKYWSDSTLIQYRRAKYTVKNNDEITAYFSPKKIKVHHMINPLEGGYILGEEEYDYNEDVVLTAVPNNGYEFDKWQFETEISSTLRFIAKEEKWVYAKFKKKKYTVTVLVDGSGGTVSGGGEYEFKNVATIEAKPASGYFFSHWEGDYNGGRILKIGVEKHIVLTAVFKQHYTNLIYDN